jgi:hemolysin III
VTSQLKKLPTISTVRPYTLGEEITHSVTHGIGAGLSIAGLTVLVVLAVLYGNVYQIVGFSIYGATLIILYLASTLYHSFQQPRVKHIFQVIDHAAIAFPADSNPWLVGMDMAGHHLGIGPVRG